jgi:hypothetical protein
MSRVSDEELQVMAEQLEAKSAGSTPCSAHVA